ncbi:MAG: hypothetical protein F4Y03_18795 [Alphaproteobacteria bacterium]|nr:hypothetical protein [Alphaproteobacteria bacterium]
MTSPTDPLACRDLWRSVLVTIVKDLCGTAVDRAAVREAERWIGSWMSRDFLEVCELAGADPARTHAELTALLPLSPRERRAEVRARRHALPELSDAA